MILLKDDTMRNKLSPLWKGPYKVLKVLDNENIVIQRGRKSANMHKNNVKKYYDDTLND